VIEGATVTVSDQPIPDDVQALDEFPDERRPSDLWDADLWFERAAADAHAVLFGGELWPEELRQA
jgi:hypothetical protein